MKKYKTGGYGKNLIQEVEAERETDKCVYIKRERFGKTVVDRHSKCGGYDQYHDTWEDAKEYLLKAAERKTENARRNLQLANSHLGNIKGLKQ